MFPITKWNESFLFSMNCPEAEREGLCLLSFIISTPEGFDLPYYYLIEFRKSIICLFNILHIFKCKVDLVEGWGEIGCFFWSVIGYLFHLSVLDHLENENVPLYLEPRHS